VVVSKFRHPVRSMNPLVRGDTRSDPEPISSNESNVDRFRCVAAEIALEV
jgi:hypothetical protein